jgi:hypothetical protein
VSRSGGGIYEVKATVAQGVRTVGTWRWNSRRASSCSRLRGGRGEGGSGAGVRRAWRWKRSCEQLSSVFFRIALFLFSLTINYS